MDKFEKFVTLAREMVALEEQLRLKYVELKQLAETETKKTKAAKQKKPAKKTPKDWKNGDDEELYAAILGLLKDDKRRSGLRITEELKAKKHIVAFPRVMRCLKALKKGGKIESEYAKFELRPGFFKTAEGWFLPTS